MGGTPSRAEIDRRTHEALGTCGLDLCELFLLGTAKLESPAPLRVFPSFAKTLSDGDARGSFTVEQLDAGLRRLQSRGLLYVISEADIQAGLACQKAAGVPARRALYHADDVVLTTAGLDLYVQVTARIWGGPDDGPAPMLG